MRLIFGVLLLALAFFSSCSSDCDPDSFAADINAEVDNVNDVGAIFANDPTEDNCKAYKEAAEQYLDAVESYDGCEGVDSNQFSQQLQQARQLLDALPCG